MTKNFSSTLLEQIEALENKRQEAMVKKDFKTLSSLLDDDLIYVHSTGKLMSKTEYLDHLGSEHFAYESIKSEAGGRHIEWGGGVILVRHLAATMEIEDKHVDTRLTVLTVWKRSGEAWTLVSSVSAKMSG
jgi:ketosteroid isomerase-like protein